MEWLFFALMVAAALYFWLQELAGKAKAEGMAAAASFEARMQAPVDARTLRDWGERKAYVWRRDGSRCARCLGVFGLQIHHKVPLSSGARNDSVLNLELLCAYCHSEEHCVDLVSSAIARQMKRYEYSRERADKRSSCRHCGTAILEGDIYYDDGYEARCELCLLSLTR